MTLEEIDYFAKELGIGKPVAEEITVKLGRSKIDRSMGTEPQQGE